MITQAIPATAGRVAGQRRRLPRVVAVAGWLVFAASLFLLIFAALYPAGLVAPYPLPPAAALDGPLGRKAPIIDAASLVRRPEEPMPNYYRRLTESVADGMVHYWTAGDVWQPRDARYTGISIFDNYLLWGLARLPRYHAHLGNYEFVSPHLAIARGYGFCSQVSKLVYAVLRERGLAARVMASDSHVVVESAGTILDADYGVFVPHDLAWLRGHPEAIDAFYSGHAAAIPLLKRAYADEWRVLGSDAVFDDSRAFEERAERLKWLLPILGMLVGLGLVMLGVRMGRPRHPGRAS